MAIEGKKILIPRDKKTRRIQRLKIAASWIKTYPGKNIVKGYAKHFGVDLLAAVIELRILGVTISADYEAAVKRSIEDSSKRKKIRREQRAQLEQMPDVDSDGDFSFIAGYTSGGAPYGTRCDETENEDQ